jgi:hypothetical protein
MCVKNGRSGKHNPEWGLRALLLRHIEEHVELFGIKDFRLFHRV